MIYKTQIALAVTTLILATTAPTAEAAKGVKKNATSNTPRVVTGQIMNVSYNSNNGTGSVFLKVPNHHKKTGATQQASGFGGPATSSNSNKGQEFLATTNTRLVNYNGTPGNPSSLQHGTRVRLTTTGNNTSSIQILTHPRSSGHFARMGTNNYRPHNMSHTTLHTNHHRRR